MYTLATSGLGTALLLPDGTVLSAGGGEPPATGQTDHFDSEIFSPPYLFNADGSAAARPVIAAAPASIAYGQPFIVGVPAATSISAVTLVRLASVTHSFNENQRLVRLSFSSSADLLSLNVIAPARAALAPPGHYLLFIIGANGAPSIARIVQLG